MANLAELSQWVDGIHQLETTDEAIGGPDGMANLQAKQLANRTQFLKALIESAQNALSGHNAATDPHPQYLTTAEGNSLIANAVSALVNSSPATLDTLNELAAALGNDPNFATSMATALGNKQPLDQTLTALAALATAANKLIYATGQDTFGLTDITAFGRAVLACSNAGSLNEILTAIPAGKVGYFAMTSAPSGWLKANGAPVSRVAYSALYSAIGTTFGSGDGATTFNLPDLRGEFLRGYDDGRGVDTGRIFGSWQANELLTHYHTVVSGNNIVAVTPYGMASGDGNRYSFDDSRNDGNGRGYDLTTTSVGGTETRPRNISLLACIKY